MASSTKFLLGRSVSGAEKEKSEKATEADETEPAEAGFEDDL